MDRRNLILGSTFLFTAGRIPSVRANDDATDIKIIGAVPPLPSDLAGNADQPPAIYSATRPVGAAPPSTDEIDHAYDILVSSPFGVAPIDIAQYFLAVGSGAYGAESQPYAREWPVRANPLIFHFFSATQTSPEGDTTAWCAAFVNWCLARSKASSRDEIGSSPGAFSQNGKPFKVETLRDHTTNNASSGSFRCWDSVAYPKRGDIAVFKDPGTDSLTAACRGSGHVAFVLGTSNGLVRVLGGNQSQKGCNGAVTVADMKTSTGSRFMKYVNVR
ncbi:hypothetical protein DK419_15580 [Methylobacterium terrae]|uniref:Peptidase C51 domain-containing protein n=1 Tax=Methylobacterium terrae TaxID=2202827 RepID=A0A2U8WVI8_9HYPH|nr:CHAP domain-containing protein [Methylobacterium terrae]AWN50079.1 hypothetical protein DK419_15580 [Methylobacterium terrae]